MPDVTLALDHLHESVERPAILDVLRHVLEITRVSAKTPILFLGQEAKALQQGSVGVGEQELGANRWPYNERVKIEVDEDYDPNLVAATALNRPEYPFVFVDEALGVYLRPAYAHTKVTINVRYQARDRNDALRWRAQMHQLMASNQQVFLHEINYHYVIPKKLLVVLHEVWRLREQQAGYGEDWNSYFTAHLSPLARIVAGPDGTSGVWGVVERPYRVQGYFDAEPLPDKAEREGEHDAWSTSLSYKFEYQKPLAMNLVYPLLVHNQLIPYRPKDKPYSPYDQPGMASVSVQNQLAFESEARLLQLRAAQGVSIPAFDEFYPANLLPSSVRIFTGMAIVDPNQPTALFNLETDLERWALQPQILAFLKDSEWPYLGQDYASVFSLCLYRGPQRLVSGSITADAALNLSAREPMSVRLGYHVRLGLVADPTFLSAAALVRLKQYPAVRTLLLTTIDAALRGNGVHDRDLKKNRLSIEDRLRYGETVAQAFEAYTGQPYSREAADQLLKLPHRLQPHVLGANVGLQTAPMHQWAPARGAASASAVGPQAPAASTPALLVLKS